MSDIEKVIAEYTKSGFDFGFSGSDQNVEKELGDKDQIIASLKERLTAVEKIVMPFYVNLTKAKGNTITWPEEKRKKEMTEQMEKVLKLTRV